MKKVQKLNKSLFEGFKKNEINNLVSVVGGVTDGGGSSNGTGCSDGPSDTKTFCTEGDYEITTRTADCGAIVTAATGVTTTAIKL